MTQYVFELNNELPNQTFSTTLNNVDLEVILKTSDDLMLFALKSGDEYICPYVPACSNQGLLPYPYMESEVGGNFFFVTENGEYPYYENFGTTCSLYFITEEELN